MIIVAGATGTVGSHVVVALQARKSEFKALVRSEAAARKLEAQGIATVSGDLNSAASLSGAFADADVLFLLTAASPAMLEQERTAIEAARKANVHRIVKLSGIGASADSSGVFQRVHGESRSGFQLRCGIRA